ncbi:hypothetical protein GWK47_025541 [Chionoecetes opilio]|uniref:RNA-directed DNA polymerase n=1 Tax=Chionoecetes opilio TaxID=41210 RepID=A0A8J8WNL5_CHIOP|nr:hypothetical protein GWK47_025541 [Chionoecetes opilio]
MLQYKKVKTAAHKAKTGSRAFTPPPSTPCNCCGRQHAPHSCPASESVCSCCGRTGHWTHTVRCPAKSTQCCLCGCIGHYDKCCSPMKPNGQQQRRKQRHGTSVFRPYSPGSQPQDPQQRPNHVRRVGSTPRSSTKRLQPINVTVTHGNVSARLQMLPDTGADVTVIGLEHLRHLGLSKHDLEPLPKARRFTADGSEMHSRSYGPDYVLVILLLVYLYGLQGATDLTYALAIRLVYLYGLQGATDLTYTLASRLVYLYGLQGAADLTYAQASHLIYLYGLQGATDLTYALASRLVYLHGCSTPQRLGPPPTTAIGGVEAPKRRAGQAVYWPGINSDIANTVQACGPCQVMRPSQQQEPLLSGDDPTRPFESVSADLFTSFLMEWQTKTEICDRRAANRAQDVVTRYNAHSRPLPRLKINEQVRLQDPTSLRWDKVGTIMGTGRSRDYKARLPSGPFMVDVFVKYNTAITSAAAVERLFSQGSDIMKAKRASLTSDNFGRLVFMKGNMDLLNVELSPEDSV